jgi:hypothetical protein
MITALKGSLPMLAWSATLLFSCIVMFAFFFNQTLTAYVIESPTTTDEQKQTCFKYFGTFWRAVFSMFELTLANWIPIARFLMEDVSEGFIIFAIMYKLSFGFSVLAVINGCFIKETFKVAAADDLLMVLEREKEQHVHRTKMIKLLEAGDTSGNGFLERDEFQEICHDKEVKAWLGAQGLDASNSDKLFTLMDKAGKEHLLAEDLVSGVAKLKGPAKALDLAFGRWEANQKEQEILSQVDAVLSRLNSMERTLNSSNSGEAAQPTRPNTSYL